jgi:hypothetical protein
MGNGLSQKIDSRAHVSSSKDMKDWVTSVEGKTAIKKSYDDATKTLKRIEKVKQTDPKAFISSFSHG